MGAGVGAYLASELPSCVVEMEERDRGAKVEVAGSLTREFDDDALRLKRGVESKLSIREYLSALLHYDDP